MEVATARKSAVGSFLFAVAVFLFACYVALVYHGDLDTGAEWVSAVDFTVWVVIFAVALTLVLVVLLFLYFALPAHRRGEEAVVRVECKNCSTPFEVVDSGDRPLYFSCPNCGVQDVLAGPPAAEEHIEFETAEPVAAAPEGEEALVVRCTNCQEVFELPFTATRPVYGNCPRCAKRGVLPPEATQTGVPVQQLEGVGATYGEKLDDAGIHTSEQLRVADAPVVAEETGIPLGNLESWKAMSDLMRIKGIGPQYAEVLARAGVRDAGDLASRDPKRLADDVVSYLEGLEAQVAGGGIQEARVRGWVQAAKRYVRTHKGASQAAAT